MEQNPQLEQTEGTVEELKIADGVITVVVTADNHLGYIAPGQPPRKRELRKQQLRHAFQQATDFAIGQGVDLFVQAGDLFDTTNPDEQDRSFVAERLSQLRHAGIRTFAIGGIHDTSIETSSVLDGAKADFASSTPSPQQSYARLGALHYFARPTETSKTQNPAQAQENRQLEPVVLDIRGTQVGICGLSATAGQEGDPLEFLRVNNDLDRVDMSLLILHAPIEGFTTESAPGEIQALVNQSSIANQSIFRYILAGYHHAYGHVSIGQCDLIVAGATQHIDFNDPVDEAGFVFLGLAADGIRWCKHIALESLQLRRLVVSARDLMQHDPETDHSDITDNIVDRLRPLCTEDAMVQLRFEGELTRERYHQLDLKRIRRYGEKHCFALSIDDSALSFLSEIEIASSADGNVSSVQRDERFSPREELVALAGEWIALAPDEQEREALQATKEELLAALRQM
ncbi:MAG: metallophosphoesterase family protein [Ktedonobacteraceae bacterium]